MNTYIAVDTLWSYNFIGGLDEFLDVTPQARDEAFHLVSRYLIHRYNFHLTHLGNMFNPVVQRICIDAEQMGMPQSYFMFYTDALFRKLLPSFNMINQMFQVITPICDQRGELMAVVIGCAVH